VQFELRLEKKSDQSQGYREKVLGNKCVKKSPPIFFLSFCTGHTYL